MGLRCPAAALMRLAWPPLQQPLLLCYKPLTETYLSVRSGPRNASCSLQPPTPCARAWSSSDWAWAFL